MHSDDFKVAEFGAADERVGGSHTSKTVAKVSKSKVNKAPGQYSTLLFVPLLLAVLVLFVLLFRVNNQLDNVQQQVHLLNETLNISSSENSTTELTLVDRVALLEKNTGQNIKKTNLEITKLWAIYQNYRPAFKIQQKNLVDYKKQLLSLQQQLLSFQKQIKAQAQGLDSKLSTELDQMNADFKAVQVLVKKSDESLQQNKNRLRQLVDRISLVELTQKKNPLAKRLEKTEKALKNYDANRLEINRNLKSINKRINALQHKLKQQ